MGDHTSIVVIGEPDAATSALYQRALGAYFRVFAAHDAGAILALLGSLKVAAVVVEPADGWDKLEAVGRACAAAGVPLVICSTQDERRRGRDLGAAAYLVKPTLPTTLIETVRQVLTTATA